MALSPAGHGAALNQPQAPSWQAWAVAPAPLRCRGSGGGVRCYAESPDHLAEHLLAVADGAVVDNAVVRP